MKKNVLVLLLSVFYYGIPNAQNTTDAAKAVTPQITVDFSRVVGKIKPLHGVNNGPFNYGAMSAPISGYHADAGFPYTRLHDVNWPNSEALDIHAIFPIFEADADDPKNYIFAKSDDYIAAVVRNKSAVIYRLGETIEHFTSYFIHPPKDYEKWAKICINIIRHYNEGWNNGFYHDIKYWEIWNEPENKNMWRGTHQQYFELYETAAKAIKNYNPSLKVGGPGAVGQESDFVKNFLGYCRDKSVPLDFFSWHMYSDDPHNMARHSKQARAMLDEYGFKKTESHLNEWHYLDGGELFPGTDKNLERYAYIEQNFKRTVGPAGAAFSASVLIRLQDSYVDVANFYCADYYNVLSMFNLYGVPSKVYYSFKAFNQLYRSGNNRVSYAFDFEDSTISFLPGISENKDTATLLLSNFSGAYKQINIALKNFPGKGVIRAVISAVDDFRDLDILSLEDISVSKPTLDLQLLPNSVYLIKLIKSRK